MSGIAGIIHFDGKPVEPELIEKMTSAMVHRGPDGINHWVKGSVALGYCMLRVSTDKSDDKNQPCTLDGQVWITADARIDGRAEVVRMLLAAGYHVPKDVPDAELILHTYMAFDEAFLDHIIGDFALAIWDSRNAKLICARDHFGVRPFFYAKTHHALLFASDIGALLNNPEISSCLDEEAIGDFLLFGNYQNPGLSVYKDVRRLPAAHYIHLTPDRFHLQQYWTLPLEMEFPHKHDAEYIDQFQQLFEAAVNDRLRTNRVAVELSGGLDSTSIAAVAKSGGCSVTAYTITCQGLLPDDQEGYYAGIVASYLKIPIFYQANENYTLFDRFDDPQLQPAEPSANPDLAVHRDKLSHIISSGARVLLSGQGGDAMFTNSSADCAYFFQRGQIARLFLEIYRHLRATGSVAGLGLRSALIGSTTRARWKPVFPEWVDTEFSRRTQLKDRWDLGWATIQGAVDIYEQLRAPWISATFENYEALKMPFIARHPFFDVRLAMFMASIPNYLKTNKLAMREAMRGKLPELVRIRPKTALAGDHLRARFTEGRVGIRLKSNPDLARHGYVNPVRYREAFQKYLEGDRRESIWYSWHMITPIALNNWLIEHSKLHFKLKENFA